MKWIAFAAAIASASFALTLAPASFAFADDGPDAPAADLAAEAPYLAEKDAAITTMESRMSVQPTGDVDRDFVAVMIPHQQATVDLATAVARYGRNEQLKQIARQMIITGQEQMDALRFAIGQDR